MVFESDAVQQQGTCYIKDSPHNLPSKTSTSFTSLRDRKMYSIENMTRQ